MLKNIILVLIAITGFFSSADNVYTNDISANTITIRATIDKKDLVNVRGDQVWLTHVKGEYPNNIQINGNSWTPIWNDGQESDTFMMKNPPRFLPMTRRMEPISVSFIQTNATIKVLEYPDKLNEWMLVISLNNMKNDNPTQMDVTVSWKKESMPIAFPNQLALHEKPEPTPTGLR